MMRKLIWCCTAIGVLAAGSFLSLSYYVCRYPDSVLGRCLYTIAEASLSMQPLHGLASRAMRSSQTDATTSAAEGVPDDPKPIIDVAAANVGSLIFEKTPANEEEADTAPIVIPEDDPMPSEQIVPPVAVTPSCREGGDPTPPVMPYADEGDDKPIRTAEKKAGDSSEESERKAFKEWMKLLESTEEGKSPAAEELPPPTEEEPETAPKCQEDSHRHEHYPGCPRVTCPYSGKSSPSAVPAKKRGHEESSEEPPSHDKKSHDGKGGKDKDECPRVPGVDTMEYRPSDAGLNEYDPGPLH